MQIRKLCTINDLSLSVSLFLHRYILSESSLSAVAGIDHPYPGVDPCMKINEIGQRLAGFAKRWGVQFEFQALAGKWESFTARDFDLKDDEVLVVKSCCMHKIYDECVLSGSPRELLLKRIRSLNPKVNMDSRKDYAAIYCLFSYFCVCWCIKSLSSQLTICSFLVYFISATNSSCSNWAGVHLRR